MSIKSILSGAIVAMFAGGAAVAEPKAPTVWAPPAEISGKPAPAPSATPAAPPASGQAATAPSAADPKAKAAKEQECAAQAKAKGLKSGKKWSFIAECVKN